MPSKHVNAGATKAFFVRMLTRDIELADAILDLLDNCVDGIVRDMKRRNVESNGKPYDGYWAKIIARPDRFEIWDNCGGIPEDVATKYAFMLGRPDPTLDDDIETVGMYGIGMKRAMFKLGRHSVVTSQTKMDATYKVEITPEWLEDDDNWNLTLEPCDSSFRQHGTKIEITHLRDEVVHQFSAESTFLAYLETEISRHYALILDKGFSVKVNTSDIKPVNMTILCPRQLSGGDGPVVEPYVFVGEFDGVHVDLAVGFYRPHTTEEEADKLLQKSTRENAGWTVICNDRIVLYNDKSIRTGWGSLGVPGYHNQFISITGAVTFRSNNSMKLPLNTTKRGIDMNTAIYPIVLSYMTTGMKKFTQFTNHWKGQEEIASEFFRGLVPVRANEVAAKMYEGGLFSPIRKHTDRGHGAYYAPTLPRPEHRQRAKRVCFSAEQPDIDAVAQYYFDSTDVPKMDVGRRCFDESLERARESRQ